MKEVITPQPWEWRNYSGVMLMSEAKHKPVVLAANKQGQLVTSVDGILTPLTEDNANATFIVKACNNHEALANALKLVCSVNPKMGKRYVSAFEIARAAIERIGK